MQGYKSIHLAADEGSTTPTGIRRSSAKAYHTLIVPKNIEEAVLRQMPLCLNEIAGTGSSTSISHGRFSTYHQKKP
jgi:hypothetical protein